MNWKKRLAVLAIGVLLLASVTGCPILGPQTAVLAGTWELTGQVVSPDVTAFLLTFNTRGEITRLKYDYKGATVNISPSLILSSSVVSNSNVSIVASWRAFGSLNSLSFEGTLDSAQTVIEGTTDFVLIPSLGVIVTVPAGPATLTRQ